MPEDVGRVAGTELPSEHRIAMQNRMSAREAGNAFGQSVPLDALEGPGTITVTPCPAER